MAEESQLPVYKVLFPILKLHNRSVGINLLQYTIRHSEMLTVRICGSLKATRAKVICNRNSKTETYLL